MNNKWKLELRLFMDVLDLCICSDQVSNEYIT